MHFEICAYAGAESASTHGYENIVNAFQFLQDLHGHCTLAFHNAYIIKGRDKSQLVFFRKLFRCEGAVVERIALKPDFNPFTPEHPGLVDFLFGGDHGHENDTVGLQFLATVGKTLGMVAGAGTNNTFAK